MSLVSTSIRLRRAVSWVDLLVLTVAGALFYGLLGTAREWHGALTPTVEINLSPAALPGYTFFSLVRGFAAYAVSFLFTLTYGYVAAYHRRAEKIMLPLLDILQSIPVLGFLPGLVLALVAIFPRSNVGLELAAVLMIFTGQVWNMTFSFYNSLKSIPNELREAAKVYKLGWWQRFTTVEMPYAALGLIWNSMMSMAGGWFFLTITEAFVLGDHDFRLPGIGSYMSVAIAQGNVPAMLYAITAMTLMIILVDQVFWRPIVAWAQKYKFEESETDIATRSFVLDLLQRSHIIRFAAKRIWTPAFSAVSLRLSGGAAVIDRATVASRLSWSAVLNTSVAWLLRGAIAIVALWGGWKFCSILFMVTPGEWGLVGTHLALTLGRVAVAVALGTVLMIPLGVMIGLNPKLSQILQPVAQVAASFPAPMLFPLVILALAKAGIGIEWGAIALMLLGTQWYILFNVIAGAMAIPNDLREAALVSRLTRWQTWKRLILPGIFPSLVTGWVTATGGAWNASIVAEYVHFGDRVLVATGLGSAITIATDRGNFALLAAGVTAMAATVILTNRLLWRKLYRTADEKFGLNK